MFCPKCGAKNPDGARFCSSCGANLNIRQAQQVSDPTYRTPTTVIGDRGGRLTQVPPHQQRGVIQE